MPTHKHDKPEPEPAIFGPAPKGAPSFKTDLAAFAPGTQVQAFNCHISIGNGVCGNFNGFAVAGPSFEPPEDIAARLPTRRMLALFAIMPGFSENKAGAVVIPMIVAEGEVEKGRKLLHLGTREASPAFEILQGRLSEEIRKRPFELAMQTLGLLKGSSLSCNNSHAKKHGNEWKIDAVLDSMGKILTRGATAIADAEPVVLPIENKELADRIHAALDNSKEREARWKARLEKTGATDPSGTVSATNLPAPVAEGWEERVSAALSQIREPNGKPDQANKPAPGNS